MTQRWGNSFREGSENTKLTGHVLVQEKAICDSLRLGRVGVRIQGNFILFDMHFYENPLATFQIKS